MELHELVATSRHVARTRKRLEKVERLAACLARLEAHEPRRSQRAGQPIVYRSAACRRRRVDPSTARGPVRLRGVDPA